MSCIHISSSVCHLGNLEALLVQAPIFDDCLQYLIIYGYDVSHLHSARGRTPDEALEQLSEASQERIVKQTAFLED